MTSPDDKWEGATDRGRALIAAMRVANGFHRHDTAEPCPICQRIADAEWDGFRNG